MKIILLGAPGCGKGTQAAKISEKYNLPHISTGDIFRANIANKTPLGLKVKEIMDSGNFCPDEITIQLVKERLAEPDCANGYLLDGFPRDMVQATALDGFNPPDMVVNIDVDLQKIEKRITGRRVCKLCGNSFHIDFIGDTAICPDCNGELIIRKDDNVETVKKRLEVYEKNTQPLIEYYSKQNKLKGVNGDLSIDGVFEEIEKIIG